MGEEIELDEGKSAKPAMDDPQLRKLLEDTLDAMDRLLRLFRVERVLHLGIGVIGFLLLVYAIVLLIGIPSASDGDASIPTELLVSLFGAGGLITASSARITFFFNKAFGLIEDIVRAILRGDTR